MLVMTTRRTRLDSLHEPDAAERPSMSFNAMDTHQPLELTARHRAYAKHIWRNW